MPCSQFTMFPTAGVKDAHEHKFRPGVRQLGVVRTVANCPTTLGPGDTQPQLITVDMRAPC